MLIVLPAKIMRKIVHKLLFNYISGKNLFFFLSVMILPRSGVQFIILFCIVQLLVEVSNTV